MQSLWARFDRAHDIEPIPGPHLNNALTGAALTWLDDRLVQDDVMEALREVVPAAPEETLFAILGAIGRAVRQP